MKGTNIGELEELALLVVANLGKNAYGLTIRNFIRKECKRGISLSTVHATLHRLEKKKLLISSIDNTYVTERGGRPKVVFSISASGEKVLAKARDMRNRLWKSAFQV